MSEIEALARALDPDAFEEHDIERRSTIAAIQWAARRHMATEGAKKVLASEWLAAHDREKQAEAVLHAANEVGSLLEVGPIDTRSRAICDAQDIMFRVAAEYRNTGNTEGTNNRG